MHQSINIDNVVSKINSSQDNRSIAEKFIDAIRDYNLSDSQAQMLYRKVKVVLNQRINRQIRMVRKRDRSHWALTVC